ncbi:uncharacterized protein LOC143197297 isoform X2 [Rhynchophorus ferrugineus]
MLKLIILGCLLFTAPAMARSPRIYNVLISSKKNLSPSHAQPVYEPVLRTTSVGYAFPTLFYHSTFVQGLPLSYINTGFPDYRRIDPPYSLHGENYLQSPVSLPYNQNPQLSDLQKAGPNGRPDSYALNYAKYLPNDQSERQGLSNNSEDKEDLKTVVANLKKNPNIPDVPPPPLPVKTSSPK